MVSIIELINNKASELQSKGFTEDQAWSAIKSSMRWASKFSSKLSPEIRDVAFKDLLIDNLKGSEIYLRNVRWSAENHMWERGLAYYGFTVGSQASAKYQLWAVGE